MPTSVITRKSLFPVTVGNSNKPVGLEVSYGYSQIGGSALFSSPTAAPLKGDVFTLGPAKDVAGKSWFVRSVVADVSTFTNLVQATYKFTCGTTVIELSTVPLEVENDGDPAVLMTRFDFN